MGFHTVLTKSLPLSANRCL